MKNEQNSELNLRTWHLNTQLGTFQEIKISHRQQMIQNVIGMGNAELRELTDKQGWEGGKKFIGFHRGEKQNIRINRMHKNRGKIIQYLQD